MAIVKMKHLRLLGLSADRDSLLKNLQHLGCVEISEQTDKLSDPEWAGLVERAESDRSRQEHLREEAAQAISVLDQYAPEKASFLAPRKQVEETELFRQSSLEAATAHIQAINGYARSLQENAAQAQKLQLQRQALLPWQSLDLSLSTESTPSVCVAFGMIPASQEMDAVRQALSEKAEASELFVASTDTEMHYLLLLCHRSDEEAALDVLKSFGFSTTVFKGIDGTAAENIAALDRQLSALSARAEELTASLSALGDTRGSIELCYDSLTQEIEKEGCKERLLDTERTFLLEGWVTAPEEEALKTMLQGFDCAYELSDPDPEDYPEVPVKLKNGPLSRCMNVVTEMYSLPAYDGIDPNPLMAPFFIFFFGMMMADMAYGIIMVAAALVVLKKTRPRESTRNFMELVLLCGISTFIFGAMTGGFFGDFIPQLLKIINPDSTFQLPALFTPLDDTVAILLGSLVLGVIQVITGMVISVVKKIKDGDFWSAFWDEITWWIILAGAALAILGIGSVGGVPVVLVIGCLMLVYGAGRNAKGFGKVTALIGAVYNGVTGYFSDILSYLRLMALMLSGSVIAQVFNTLGSVFGNILIFIIISMIGNALNLALNLLGCYVHDLRLQCLEFFNRFYKDGGKAYKPLSIQTKYHDIIKEEI